MDAVNHWNEAVWLPTIGQVISDYLVVLHFRPDGFDTATLTLMAPEEVSCMAVNGPVSAI
jgi:hypothetical protein